jgi:flagellar biosynthetic protein FliQ
MGDLGRELALALASDTLWTALLVGAPVLLLSMVVGLVISIFQVVTQIQEASLSFVPKIAAVLLALVAFGPWMLSIIVQFATRLIGNIPTYF